MSRKPDPKDTFTYININQPNSTDLQRDPSGRSKQPLKSHKASAAKRRDK